MTTVPFARPRRITELARDERRHRLLRITIDPGKTDHRFDLTRRRVPGKLDHRTSSRPPLAPPAFPAMSPVPVIHRPAPRITPPGRANRCSPLLLRIGKRQNQRLHPVQRADSAPFGRRCLGANRRSRLNKSHHPSRPPLIPPSLFCINKLVDSGVFRIYRYEPKRLSNFAKHGLDFATITNSFFDHAVATPVMEGRIKFVGTINKTSGVVVIAAPLGREAISIISLRRANRKERKTMNAQSKTI